MFSPSHSIIEFTIISHACLGAVGMIAGIIAALSPKGAKYHRMAGKIFSSSMLLSCLLALIISLVPGHKNSFLQMIGFFTIYQIISGLRALLFTDPIKKPNLFWLDVVIASTLTAQGCYLLGAEIMSISLYNKFNILNLAFGSLWIALSIGDFRFFYRRKPNAHLHAHITKMSGALIASITAFVVAGIGFSNLIGWMAPGVVGSVLITWSRRKIKNVKFLSQTPVN